MNDWGIYKPILTTLALPPVPFLLLILIGARLILPRRGLGYLVLMLGVLGVWMSTCQVTAVWLQDRFLHPPVALQGEALARLELVVRKGGRSVQGGAPPAAIIVLGGGREAFAMEYGTSDLSKFSAERLRYGIWLVRRTGLPLGFSGGVGWAQRGDKGASEADIAAKVAQQTYGVPMRWVEAESVDTRGNAALTVAMLADQHVPEIVLVTDAFHMPRALRDFEQAAQRHVELRPGSPVIKVTPAPMGFWQHEDRAWLDWMPSIAGSVGVRLALKECLAALLKT
ncbi:MAG: YdcF family protein [Aquabacterium sp.]|uniref:YdcF family protein n=1 Tax=Aquabacterium sp. TaxID=1872578 RepID=UPI001206BE81|nr:YdcF family protein [Aquabacterium sp.]TAK93397.1 MAG: YdcF family protein [Aquabacterium sp.]